MKFSILKIFNRSATIELDNEDRYTSQTPYSLTLNGERIAEDRTENVYSIYDLEPDTRYAVTLTADGLSHTETFVTLRESVRLDVTRFGAVGDASTVNTGAIQAAILCCPLMGTVYIPKGVFMTGPIFLKSDMTLELDEGAVLRGITEREQYPILPGMTMTTDESDEYNLGTWEGDPLSCMASLITGIHVKNVTITGRGVIDGNAQNGDWWINPRVKRRAWRPRTVFFNGCRKMCIHGVTVQNSPSWTLHGYFTRELEFVNIRIFNHSDSPNTDGIDLESCSNVEILGVHISVGDDCIAIKSGKMYMGRKHKTPSREIVARNCLMERGHGALVIGSETSAGVNHIRVEKCIFQDTDRGLRLKTRRGRGNLSVLDRITIENVYMNGVLTPFVANMFYFCDIDGKSEYVYSKEKLPVDDYTPQIGSIECRRVTCENCSVAGMFFYGLPEMPIQRIELTDVSVSFAPGAEPGQPAMMDGIADVKCLGLFAANVETLRLKNVRIIGYEGEKLRLSGIGSVAEEE